MEEEKSVMKQKVKKQKFRFFLEEDDPQEKYYKGLQKEMSNLSVQWGQRKLLLVELFLLLNYYAEMFKEVKNVHLVYVGAGPGIHIPFITEIFKEITFHLYDTKFSFDPFPNTVLYRKFFDEEEALKWRDNCSIFLSDIRNPKFHKVDDTHMKEMEKFVAEDMNKQKEWVEIIRPKLFMLKFRLPYYFEELNIETIEYLDGKILKQPYAKRVSTETRLIGTEIKYREYNVKKYESQMFFHNKWIRTEYKFENPFSGIEPLWPPELLNDYDSVYEILVLEKLLRRLGKEVNETNIKKLSRMITFHLNQGKEMRKWRTLKRLRETPSEDVED
jgi:hypothetical protein